MALSGRVDVKTVVDRIAVLQLARSPELHAAMQRKANRMASDLRQAAPVKSGAGRASITGDVVMGPTGWTAIAGWDPQHYYMGIQNSRTRWAGRAAASVRYV